MTATLSQVASDLPGAARRGPDVSLVDVTHDSRQAGPGSLFCAITGARSDGHDHAGKAVEQGAAALLVERWLPWEIPQVRVPEVRAAAGPAAARVHGAPSAELTLLGITGTNGKTTTATLLEAVLAAAGHATGLIGTVATRIRGEVEPGIRTTPEGPDLQRLLRRMRDREVTAVAMEVSSHGLALHRVDGTRFAVVAYTNLSPDHLDLHGTMEAYLAAKAALFDPRFSPLGVVFRDGPWADALLAQARIPVVTVGHDHSAEVRLEDVHVGIDGGRARLRCPERGWDLALRTRLPGRFNVDNAAVAAVLALLAGVPAAVVSAGLAAADGAPGRLERVAGGPPTVLVDYAHTPDAVATVLATVRGLLPPGGRLHVVLGCGGDRDRDKRGPMGAAAAVGADVVVLTDDNPRSEDPAVILAAVVAGAEAARAAGADCELHVVPDRREAIARALAGAADDDVVVIAGKGHETTQEVAGRFLPFDDRRVARELLEATP